MQSHKFSDKALDLSALSVDALICAPVSEARLGQSRRVSETVGHRKAKFQRCLRSVFPALPITGATGTTDRQRRSVMDCAWINI